MIRKFLFGLAFTIVLAGGAAGGWYWWTIGSYLESTDDAYVKSDVSVIGPKVEAYVRRVAVTDNQSVKAGDLLVVLGDADLRSRFDEARAAVEIQKEAIRTVERQLDMQDATIDQAHASITSAEADRDRARQDYDRFKPLARSQYVSRQRFEAVEADRRKADANLVRSRAELAAQSEQTAILKSQKKAAESRLEQLRATLALAENDLANAEIRAPVDGVVGNRSVQTGEYVRVGTPLLSIVQLPHTYVVANFKETQLTGIRPGQPVDVIVDAYPDRTLHGTVESFAPGSGSQFSLLPPENATGNFTKIVQRVPVRIAIPDDNLLSAYLRPGLSVVATVDTKGRGDDPPLASGESIGAAQAAESRR